MWQECGAGAGGRIRKQQDKAEITRGEQFLPSVGQIPGRFRYSSPRLDPLLQEAFLDTPNGGTLHSGAQHLIHIFFL